MALVPSAIGIGEYAVAAEAIAGASFGENILGAFHLDGRSVLVTEYSVCLNDSLIDRLLAEIAYGYGVTPIIHQRGDEVSFFPSDDIRLEANDRTVVLWRRLRV
jgi:Trk K+ transport system NAD-binding subunit